MSEQRRDLIGCAPGTNRPTPTVTAECPHCGSEFARPRNLGPYCATSATERGRTCRFEQLCMGDDCGRVLPFGAPDQYCGGNRHGCYGGHVDDESRWP